MYIDRGRELSIAVFLIGIGLVLVILAPSFFTLDNLENILIYTSYVAVGALGQMLVVLTGQPDISVGSILAVCAMTAGHLSKTGMPIPLVIVAACAVGAILALVNGLLVTRLKIHSIIVTLGTLGIYRGTLLYVTGAAWVYDLPSGFRQIGIGSVLGIPNPIWIAALTMIFGALALSRTVWGRSLYAVGSSPDAARLSGLRVPTIMLSAFAVNGALVGLTSLIFAARFSTIQSNIGTGFEFLVITAVVVGGTHIFGGSGTVLGVALGSLLVGITGTVLVFLEISAFWEQAVHGLFILLAVGFTVVRARWRSANQRLQAEAS